MNNWMLEDDEKIAIDVSGRAVHGGNDGLGRRRGESRHHSPADRKRKKAEATQHWRAKLSRNEIAVRRQLENQRMNRRSLNLVPRPREYRSHSILLQGVRTVEDVNRFRDTILDRCEHVSEYRFGHKYSREVFAAVMDYQIANYPDGNYGVGTCYEAGLWRSWMGQSPLERPSAPVPMASPAARLDTWTLSGLDTFNGAPLYGRKRRAGGTAGLGWSSSRDRLATGSNQ